MRKEPNLGFFEEYFQGMRHSIDIGTIIIHDSLKL